MASSNNQNDSSYYYDPSSSSFTPRWNVFLSFRGEDTRGNFTGHLYKALDRVGIQTFMDDPELPRGEEISPALLRAIQESKISIVVISKNYASSTWCLNELMKILECRKTMRQLVLPVFYKVNPSDVRYQFGSFSEAFEKHRIRFVGDMDKVEKWRAALSEAAQLSGYHLDANGNEPDLIDQIVDRVHDEVNPRYLNVAKKPVGIASHVENITPLLSIGTNGVRKIGIYGMGGVGKTTVAKAVYNENFRSFQGSCFLADVREISGQPNGTVRLQELLVSEVLKSKKFNITNVHNGISFIEEKTRSKRVLIVLDDLDHRNQLDSLAGQWNQFASGSIIIITTRDARLLDQIQVDGRYEVEELNNNDSLELFSLHAFEKTIPPSDDFMKLSQKILSYAGGLPLALEVFGSNLFNQDELEWTSFIKKLRENPNSDIEGKLKISFDALENVDRKDIFLDIACFFIGWNKDEATTILSACYSCAENDIRILTKRCLLKFNDENELRMHDLLQDLGREIARNKFPGEPQKHSRLWRCVDICNVLKKDKGTKSIEGIFPYDGELDQVTLNTKTFERMHRLRLLDISKVHLTGSFEHIFKELRWLRWRICFLECLPSDFHPEKLVILDLRNSNINMLCNGNLFLEQLKILDLTGCKFLERTGDISGLASLEKLLLGGCTYLVEVHPSIGRLGKLVCLNLSYCESLTILTNRVCDLWALEYLFVNGCSNLEGLPEELGNMESIRVLKAGKSQIKKLPDSIGLLSNLHELDLNECEDLINLPSCIGQLRWLERLILDGCSNLESLPDELGKMECLTKLKARGLSIKKFPDSIGQLSKLDELDLRECYNLRFLPDNICNLSALKRLILDDCESLERLPQELGSIESLVFLSASQTSIVKLPDSIGFLRNLVELNLSACEDLINLPSSIGQLRGLERLILNCCSNLESLPEELGKMECLTTLEAGGLSIKNLPDSIGQLSELDELYLSKCTMLIELPYSIGRLTKLFQLNLSYCKNLKNLPISICSLSSLQILDIDGCSNLEWLPEDVYSWNANGSFVAKVSALLAEDRDMSWMTWDQLEYCFGSP